MAAKTPMRMKLVVFMSVFLGIFLLVVLVAPRFAKRIPDQAYVALGAVLGVALRH